MDEGDSRTGASLSEEAHCGGLLYWRPWVMKGRLWGWASVFRWATRSGLVYWRLREMAERGSGGGASLCGSSVKGTWREGLLAGDSGG